MKANRRKCMRAGYTKMEMVQAQQEEGLACHPTQESEIPKQIKDLVYVRTDSEVKI